MPGAVNLPLASNMVPSLSPFDDSNVLRDQWKELEAIFNSESTPHAAALLVGLKKHFVCLVCATGDTARVASSVLRAKGVEAYSIAGGIPHVAKLFGEKL
jgi:cysteine synthase A